MVKLTAMQKPTATNDPLLTRRFSDFPTLLDAIEYAAKGQRGMNFYSARGELKEAVTYSEFRDRAEDIGKRLVALGTKAGDRVALIAETSADFVSFFVGCQYASVLPVPLPLPTSFGGREGYMNQLSGQIKSCGVEVVITPEGMKNLIVEATQKLKTLFVGTPKDFMARTLPGNEIRVPKYDDLAYLQYSSGSTRFPHGVAVTNHSLMANCHGMGYHGVKARDGDRCVSWLPFYHDMGLVGTLLTSLTCQISVDFLATEDFARRPMMWLNLLSTNKGTITYSPTFGYDICARRTGPDALATLDLSPCRVFGIGGDMIRPGVLTHFAKTFAPAGFKASSYMASYGLAECTLAVSFMESNSGMVTDKVDERVLAGGISRAKADKELAEVKGIKPHLRSVVNCGKPLPEYEVEIRDHDGKVLPEKEIGKLFVRGVSVMREYFGDPKATNEVLSKDKWLDTGDMAYLLDGCIYIAGRIKDLIIVNGKNHWPQDIEWAVEQLPGYRNGDIAAISIPGSGGEEIPTVLVHCRKKAPEDRKELLDTVKNHILKSTGITCQVVLVPPRTLPRTSSGKLSRTKARNKYLNGELVPLTI
ncbi:MAG: fatty acyl-AMP ligase [Sphingomonadales bacterium]